MPVEPPGEESQAFAVTWAVSVSGDLWIAHAVTFDLGGLPEVEALPLAEVLVQAFLALPIQAPWALEIRTALVRMQKDPSLEDHEALAALLLIVQLWAAQPKEAPA